MPVNEFQPASEQLAAPGADDEVFASDGSAWQAEKLASLLKSAILTADGDLLVRDGNGNVTRLGAGSKSQFLKMVGGVPDWQDAPGTAWTELDRIDLSATPVATVTWTKAGVLANYELYQIVGIGVTLATGTNTWRLDADDAGASSLTWNGAHVYGGPSTALGQDQHSGTPTLETMRTQASSTSFVYRITRRGEAPYVHGQTQHDNGDFTIVNGVGSTSWDDNLSLSSGATNWNSGIIFLLGYTAG